MSANVWDDPDLKFNDDYVKLENVGDEIGGRITAIRPHRYDDGSVAVQITFIDARDGAERTWSAGQVQAKKQLAELRPGIGWDFRAKLTSIEKRNGGKTLKHIDVQARPGNGAAPNQAPANTGLACPAGVDPARWAQMSADQRGQMYAALGLTTPAPAGAGAFLDEPPF